jgi:hypothetical protein
MFNPFDKFTHRARHVLTLAQEEAQRFNHGYIGTEHLLLGLVREGEGIAARMLVGLGVTLPQVQTTVEAQIGRGQGMIAGEVGLTPGAKKVVELAVDEARRLNHHYIGTEHLLLGLMREGQGIAATALAELGLTLDQLRAQLIQVLSVPPRATQDWAYDPQRARVREPLAEILSVQPILAHAEHGMTAITLIAIERYSNGFVATFRMITTGRADPHPTFAMTATDDRDGHYAAIMHGGSGGGGPARHEWRFAHRFAPALDPAAQTLIITFVATPRPRRPGEARTIASSEPWTFTITLTDGDRAP